MNISLIWAMDLNRLIGKDNALPWKLPADMKWFRQHTLGKPIVMGRKTYESFGAKPLPQRSNIVITRDHDYQSEGAIIVHSIEAAIEQAQQLNTAELMVIGGANLYQQFLPHADKLYITEVQGEFNGDTWFPDIDLGEWQLIEQQSHQADERNSHDCRFYIYHRNEAMRG